MAATYRIIPAFHLKYVAISGKTHLSELRDLATTYLEDPEFAMDHKHLIDLSALLDAKATFKDVFTLRNFHLRAYSNATQPVEVAIYAPTDLGYGISRMFSSLMSGQGVMKIQIFEDLTDALVGLGITADKEALTTEIASARQEADRIQGARHEV